jgi:WD40 repeat protein
LRHKKWVQEALFNRDESWILTCSGDGTARLWVPGLKAPIYTFEHKKFVKGALFNDDENRILTWSDDGTARVWDISFEERMSLEEQILEFQVRSGTILRRLDELKLLTFEEWMAKKRRVSARTCGVSELSTIRCAESPIKYSM